MKFHHLAHTLLESNCLLLSLRLLGLQEVSTYVVTKNELPERTYVPYAHCTYAKSEMIDRFFRYCYNTFSPSRHIPLPLPPPPQNQPHGDDGELILDFSWRNFFTVLNLVKVMQKLSKGRPHRILMLVHHKSSAIFKRMMRVQHPMLQLQLLKLIKSQVPYSGRKWKQCE